MTPTAVLTERTELGPGLLLRVQARPELLGCRPGQFLLLRCGHAWTPYLRRALFPVDVGHDSLAFWIDSLADEGIAWLSRRQVGDVLDLIGPLGKGFALQTQQRRLLLVGEAAQVAPLLALMQVQLSRQGSVALLLQAPTAAALLPPGALPPSVEYYTATDDGTAGSADALDSLLTAAPAPANCMAAAWRRCWRPASPSWPAGSGCLWSRAAGSTRWRRRWPAWPWARPRCRSARRCGSIRCCRSGLSRRWVDEQLVNW